MLGRSRALLMAVILLTAPTVFSSPSLPLYDILSSGQSLLNQVLNFDSSSLFNPILSFVSSRFLQPQNPVKGDTADRNGNPVGDNGPAALWRNIFRAFGINSEQMSSLAVNIMIFLAQLVSGAFSTNTVSRRRGKVIKDTPLLQKIVNQPKVSRLLSTMHDPKLMDIVLQEVDNYLSDGDSECVQQLLCRATPIVTGMQTSLAFFLRDKVEPSAEKHLRGEVDPAPDSALNWQTLAEEWKLKTPLERMFLFMPSYDEIKRASERCRIRFSHCHPNSKKEENT